MVVIVIGVTDGVFVAPLQPTTCPKTSARRSQVTTWRTSTATELRMDVEDDNDGLINSEGQGDSSDNNDCHGNFNKQSSGVGDSSDPCFIFDYQTAATHYGEDADHMDVDFWNRFEAQNKARQKFGLPPLTTEEYVVLQAETKAMGDQLSQDAILAAFRQFDTNGDGVISLKELQTGMRDILRAEMTDDHVESVMKHLDASGDGVLQLDEMVALKELRERLNAVIKEEQKQLQLETKERYPKQEQPQSPGLLKSFLATFRLGDEDACESNFDCVRPEVCCDFHFKKFCCSSGEMTRNLQLQYATVPVPQGY
ncbi:EF hand domain containing protein [Nitzschia inconspicua]|uniref:EF hand domain containing protein n=1 Tax=Nitzschia inconspicua TaxID=303405 RepID=A0A9K3PTP2_9STRA|nr:EF hand domain containing protein [Nitzschia inconspicua]